MPRQELQEFLAEQNNTEIATFVAHIVHELTISARGTYEVGTQNVLDGASLRKHNEITHRLSSIILRSLEGEEIDSLNQQLIGIYGQEPNSEFERQIQAAYEWVLRKS